MHVGHPTLSLLRGHAVGAVYGLLVRGRLERPPRLAPSLLAVCWIAPPRDGRVGGGAAIVSGREDHELPVKGHGRTRGRAGSNSRAFVPRGGDASDALEDGANNANVAAARAVDQAGSPTVILGILDQKA